jgi:hypothetical protein
MHYVCCLLRVLNLPDGMAVLHANAAGHSLAQQRGLLHFIHKGRALKGVAQCGKDLL